MEPLARRLQAYISPCRCQAPRIVLVPDLDDFNVCTHRCNRDLLVPGLLLPM